MDDMLKWALAALFGILLLWGGYSVFGLELLDYIEEHAYGP